MTQSLPDFAAAQLRAEMARREISASELARQLGVDESWVRRRMRRQLEITLGDLERIAQGLGMPPQFFMPNDRTEVAA